MPDPADTPVMAPTGGEGPSCVVGPVTCLVCGCLCDDLVVRKVGETVVEVENACDLSRSWFFRERNEEAGAPEAEIDGRPATKAAGVAASARLLAGARAPLIVGLTGSTTQTVAAAIRLAERIGAVIDPTGSPGSAARALALARAGRVSATLGEVKNRSDLVVFWGADPVRTHPRHGERYSVFPPGRFLPEGRSDRTVIVVDGQRTASAEQADSFVAIDRSREFEVLWTLRALVKGVPVEAGRVRRITGIEQEALQRLAGQLRQARYGALFHALRSEGCSLAAQAAVREAAQGLVRELNHHTRFVLLDMGEPGNPVGAASVLTWQTGFPAAVDLSAGYPVFLPGATTASDRLEQGEADAALFVGTGGLERAALASEHIPSIVIAPPGIILPDRISARVRLHAATTGFHEGGTVQRTDGIALPLRPVSRSRYPAESEWLEAIFEQLRTMAGTGEP